MHDLKRKVLTGTLWSGGGQVIEAGLRFGIILILARLLPPDFFGLLGMSMVIMLLLLSVSNMGFGAAIVQRRHIDETDLATIFWANLTLSLLSAALLFTAASFLAQLLGDTRLEIILRFLAILLPITACTIVSQAVLQRNLKFAQLAWRDIVGTLAFGVVGILLAILDMGYWSLIGAFMAQLVSRSVLLWLASPYRPSAQFDWNRLCVLFSFGSWMFVSMITWQLMNNIDYFVIGKFLGATNLGYYTLAFQLVIIPIQRLTGILSKVIFPSFSKIQGQPALLQSGFLQSFKMLILLLFPISAFLFVAADLLVPFLYTTKWMPAVPVVRLLACASFFYGLDFMNSILNAVGKPHWQSVVLGLRASIFVVLAWTWGIEQGIEGIAFCIMIAVALSTILQLWVLLRELNITPMMFGRAFYIPLLAVCPPTLLAFWINNIMLEQSFGLQLVAIGSVFFGLYIVLVLPGYRHELSQLLSIAKSSI